MGTIWLCGEYVNEICKWDCLFISRVLQVLDRELQELQSWPVHKVNIKYVARLFFEASGITSAEFF